MKRTSIKPLILAIIVTGLSYAVLLPNASAFSTDQAQQVLAGVQGAMVILPLGIGLATFLGATSVAHISALPSIIISGATAVIIFIAMWSVVPTFVQNAEVAQDASHPTPATPDAPLNLIANAVSTSQINLSWMAPPQPVIGYKIEDSLDGNNWNTVTSDTGSISTVYNATGLATSTTYWFRVSGVQIGGIVGSPSNIAFDSTFGIPGSPTGLSYVSPFPNEIDISWIPPVNNGGDPIIGYKIDRAFPATSNSSAFSTIVANTGNVTTYHDATGISTGTTYGYRVSTLNNVLTSAPSNILNATSHPAIVNNTNGAIVNTIATCPTLSKLTSLNTTYTSNSMIVIAPTQFQSQSTGTKLLNVYLTQNSTIVSHNVLSFRLGVVNTFNEYTLLYYTASSPNHASYQVNACTNAGTVNGIAKIFTIYGKTNVSFINGTTTGLGTSDTTLATSATSFPAGNNVIIANYGMQLLNGSTAHFVPNSFKIKNTGGSTISTNNMGVDLGVGAPTSSQYGLLVGAESNAPSNPTYTITGLKPSSSNNINGRVEMLVFSSPNISFSNSAITNVGLATTPMASLTTSFGSNSSVIAVSSTWFNNTSSSPVKIPATHYLITNGTTIASNAFDETPFANAGSAGDNSYSVLMAYVGKTGTNPTFTTDADANITGTKGATQAIAFQIAGSATSTPTNLKLLTQNSSAIKLTWTAPTSNGGFPITGYTVMQDSGSGFTKKVQTTNVTTTTINGLNSGSHYYYKIAAINALGNSTFTSSIGNYTTTLAPTNLNALTINSTAIKLTWTSPTGYKNGFKIYRESPVGNGFATLVSNTTTTTVNYNNTGLQTKTQYNYKLSAINTGGFSNNSTSVANQTSDATVVTATGSGVSVSSICSAYTNILNITGTTGNNLAFVALQFSSTSATAKQVGYKIIDKNNGVILAQNGTSLRLNTPNTWASDLLIGSESSSPTNPIYEVFVCTTANTVLAKANAVIVNGYTNYIINAGIGTTVHYYDTNKVFSTISTTSAFSSSPNVIIASYGVNGNATNTIRFPTGAIKIMNGASDLSDNQLPFYTAIGPPASSQKYTLVAIDNSPGTTPTYTLVGNSGNNTVMRGTMIALHVANAAYVTGSLQTLALDPSKTTLNTLSTSFLSGSNALTFASSMFNNTATAVKSIPVSDFRLNRDSTLLSNNTMQMRSLNPAPQTGDTFSGIMISGENLASSNPSYNVTAAANVTSSIQGYAKILSFVLTANPPTAPTNLVGVEFNKNQTNLTWSAPSSNGGSSITGYEIDRQFNGSGAYIDINSTGASTTSFNDTKRTPGYPYAYDVKAINGVGSSTASNVIKIKPLKLAILPSTLSSTLSTIVASHWTAADFGINSFGYSKMENFSSQNHDWEFCGYTTNTTRLFSDVCNVNTTYHQTPLTFINRLASVKYMADNERNVRGMGVHALWYDNEPNNPALSTPPWETGWAQPTNDSSYNDRCPKPNKNFANSCAAYYTNLAADAVHSYGYAFGAAPTGKTNGTDGSGHIWCYDTLVKKGLFDPNRCGLLWNEMNGTDWAKVDELDVQSQGFDNVAEFEIAAQDISSYVSLFFYQ